MKVTGRGPFFFRNQQEIIFLYEYTNYIRVELFPRQRNRKKKVVITHCFVPFKASWVEVPTTSSVIYVYEKIHWFNQSGNK